MRLNYCSLRRIRSPRILKSLRRLGRYMRSTKSFVALMVLGIFPVARAQASATTDYKFSFGPADADPGHVRVSPSDVYSTAKGYGFEPDTNMLEITQGNAGFVTANKPFYFFVALPEGNYNV